MQVIAFLGLLPVVLFAFVLHPIMGIIAAVLALAVLSRL